MDKSPLCLECENQAREGSPVGFMIGPLVRRSPMKAFPLVTQFAALLLLGLACVAAAQQRPNFSGTWIPVGSGDTSGQEQTIKQDATTLRRSHASEGDGHHFTYKLDGTESRIVLPSHGDRKSVV